MNAARRFRLTKFLVIAAITAATLGAGIPPAMASCAESRNHAAENSTTIALRDLDREGPLYYWSDSSTYALLYFRPEDLVARLESLLGDESGSNHDSRFGNATLVPALLDNLRVDLPLKQSMDLFRYSLIDRRFDTVMNVVIADLMQEGQFLLDQWLLDEQRTKSIVMISRPQAEHGEAARWFCTATNDVLFKIEAAAQD